MRTARGIPLILAGTVLGCIGGGCLSPDIFGILNCPDPAVTSFNVDVLSKSDGSGLLQFTVVVRNMGLQAFVSSTGQQTVQLWAGGEIVAELDFEDLAPGESVTLTQEETWLASEPVPYEARIAYSSNVLTDSNPLNNDCDTGDNSATLTANEIMAVFDAAQ